MAWPVDFMCFFYIDIRSTVTMATAHTLESSDVCPEKGAEDQHAGDEKMCTEHDEVNMISYNSSRGNLSNSIVMACSPPSLYLLMSI